MKTPVARGLLVAAYPTDDGGNVFDWINAKITVGGVQRDLKWIYGDWLAPLPRAIYITDRPGSCSNPAFTTESACVAGGGTWSATGAGMSYSCGRCHTTGWTSDVAINLTKDPEKSFPGISWDPVNHTGYVNLKGGVTGDSNNFSSWDYWGVSCTRCHSSAVDNTTNGGVPPFSAPAGMSSHHNNVTATDISSGACTDVRFTSEAVCTSSGGQWITACSTNPTRRFAQLITSQIKPPARPPVEPGQQQHSAAMRSIRPTGNLHRQWKYLDRRLVQRRRSYRYPPGLRDRQHAASQWYASSPARLPAQHGRSRNAVLKVYAIKEQTSRAKPLAMRSQASLLMHQISFVASMPAAHGPATTRTEASSLLRSA